MKLNNKGQAFESFRLLIAFVLAVAVLTIIYSMINKANAESVVISTQKFEDGIKSAGKSTGTSARIPFVIKDLRLSGIINKNKISKLANLPKDCIFFVSGPGIDNNPNDNYLRIKRKYLKMDVYVYSNFTDLSPYPTDISSYNSKAKINGCDRFMVIYLNKKPPSDTYGS